MIKYCRYALLSAAAGAVLLLIGCAGATPQQMDEFQQQLNEVRAIADEALRTANTADYQAHQAKTMADEALSGNNRMMKKLGMKKMMK